MKSLYPDTQEVVVMPKFTRMLYSILLIPIVIIALPLLLITVLVGWFALSGTPGLCDVDE